MDLCMHAKKKRENLQPQKELWKSSYKDKKKLDVKSILFHRDTAVIDKSKAKRIRVTVWDENENP